MDIFQTRTQHTCNTSLILCISGEQGIQTRHVICGYWSCYCENRGDGQTDGKLSFIHSECLPSKILHQRRITLYFLCFRLLIIEHLYVYWYVLARNFVCPHYPSLIFGHVSCTCTHWFWELNMCPEPMFSNWFGFKILTLL